MGAQPIAIYTSVDKTINESKKPEGGGDQGKKDSGGGKQKKSGGGSEKKDGGEEEKKMSLNGLAVFKLDKMVGRLNPREASLFALMTGSNNISLEVTDPLDNRFKVLSYVKKEKSSTTNVTFKNGKPVIDINLIMDINVQSVQSDNDYDETKNADKLNKAYGEMIENEIKALLEKVTYEYKSDIFGYGEMAKKNFMTIEKWEKAKWLEIFPQTKYNLRLDTEIIKHG
jgi:spore germination protein KC